LRALFSNGPHDGHHQQSGDDMKKLMIAAVAAGTLALGFAAVPADAAVRIGIGPGGVHVGVGHRKHCKSVKVWRHGHSHWVKKCW